jgi:hypothetical protein
MIIAIASLALTMLVQMAGVVWWASRMSTQMDQIATSMREARTELSALRGEVHAHDTRLAVLDALQEHASNGQIRS